MWVSNIVFSVVFSSRDWSFQKLFGEETLNTINETVNDDDESDSGSSSGDEEGFEKDEIEWVLFNGNIIIKIIGILNGEYTGGIMKFDKIWQIVDSKAILTSRKLRRTLVYENVSQNDNSHFLVTLFQTFYNEISLIYIKYRCCIGCRYRRWYFWRRFGLYYDLCIESKM